MFDSRRLRTLGANALPFALVATAACATSPRASTAGGPAGGAVNSGVSASSMSMSPPSPDPRVGLRAGWFDAGSASWNMRLVSATKPSPSFTNPSTPGDARLKNSDLAFKGTTVFQGNYSGWQAWDVSDPRAPRLRAAYVCPGSQSDVSVYGNLLFVSAEATSGRVDCGMQGIPDTVSAARARGIRIIDISDLAKPKYVTTVQTCRGSHTNTLVTDPKDAANVYIYVSGSSGVRSSNELAGCSGSPLENDPNTALFRIEVIQVPLANPSAARIVSSPRIFAGLQAAPRHGEQQADLEARPAREPRAERGPTQCHDITVYPAIGLAGGACSGYGVLLDIRDVANPRRIDAVADTNFAAWHSATFSNDGSKVLFSDEWGGGTQPRCRATDNPIWGADAIFDLRDGKMVFRKYYKMPAAQTALENCVAHNGSLIPVPGRDIMVQSWYQGGINVIDWTDPDKVVEIAFFDRGPMDGAKLSSAGHWSAYWYNGHIYGSEIARGLDILELSPSAHLSQNEIDAAKTVRFSHFNPQEQPKLVWPASFVVARAYLDQLARGRGLGADRITALQGELAAAERANGTARRTALTGLAAQLERDAGAAADGKRVRMMVGVLRELAAQ
ncbi:MAG TPA: hypothetical protein VE869_08315 [Gemmatimonas sp.]|nr:hypothetical protein [Gemmatimonas sp.]